MSYIYTYLYLNNQKYTRMQLEIVELGKTIAMVFHRQFQWRHRIRMATEFPGSSIDNIDRVIVTV